MGAQGEAQSKEVDVFMHVKGREPSQGTVGLDSMPPSSAANLLRGLRKFPFLSDFQFPHLHSGGLGRGEHQRRRG